LQDELGRQLRGAGGYVEQSRVYLDSESARAYLILCKQRRERPRLVEAARHILAATKADLLILALGAGTARSEVELVRHLSQNAPARRFDLLLCDVSAPLLMSGFVHASQQFPESKAVRIWGILCDLQRLASYQSFFPRTPCQKLFCMLDTLSELEHEPRFLEHSLTAWATQGDLLLLDFPVAPSDDLQLAALRQLDPMLASGVPMEYAQWLGDLISRHDPEVDSIEFAWEPQLRTALPGCYALDALATVHSRGRPPRRFSMYRLKRYEPAALTRCLSELGWEPLATLPYSSAGEGRSLRLFRRC
jgi:hypothetical protein